MQCVELCVPPLPQLVTAGHSVWTDGMQHFRRSFEVFDLLYVVGGTFYITEEDIEYELSRGELLLLEPGKTHWGHRPVDGDMEIYWLHFVHPHPYLIKDSEQIAWSSWQKIGSDRDLTPVEHKIYLPKHGCFEPASIVPLFKQLVELHSTLSVRDAAMLHALTLQLLAKLQSLVEVKHRSKSYLLSEQVINYLQEHMQLPFSAVHMEEKLHYHSDYLSRCLKQYTGMSPLQFLHRLQMERARSLLRQSDLTVQEIAEQIGQPNGNYFIRLFRKHYGLPPGKYREQTQELL
jgi:AraC-like DNA-binding protein